MQTVPDFRTNRDLFSNHYLDNHLPGSDPWQSVDSATLQQAYENITDLWERERDLVADRNESQLEEKFIRPMFRELGIPFEVEESVREGQRRPDYGFFESDESSRNAFTRRRDGGDFYQNAVAVADAKRWGRKLDTRGERQRDFENPSYQIHVYLQETPTTWAVLTNGRYWRLYYGPTSHRLDSYYEIDLPAVLETGDREVFKYFYLFFRHKAFLPDASGDCFLDDVYSQSNIFTEELGEDLQDNIYEAIRILAEGFLTYSDNDLAPDDLERIHDSSLVYLYRLIFVLYAESEGRDLLNTDNEIYRTSYSLNTIKQEVAEELDSTQPRYQSWQDTLWDRIDELFQLIGQGSESHGIPEDELHVPAYNGGLFRTNPGEEDSREAQFLATHTVGDEYLAQVIELLTRSQTGSEEKIFVDYSSLDVRHLGSIYEGLLEYTLNIADEPLTLDDGEYVVADDGDDIVVEPDAVYLTTDSGERKATGSYYTPEYVVEYIVENTLEPLVTEIREDLVGSDASGEGGFAEEFAQRIFDLKVLDPSMGSGHFLTNAVDYLAREIIDAQERQAEQQGVETIGQEHDIKWARRQVAQHCIYGVDLNPLAVELAKVSLWLRTLAAEQPLAFLDHHLKTGNALVGSDIEDIDELETDTNDGPNASLAEFGAVRRGTIDHLMEVYEEFIAIENTDLADAKEMERKYREIEHDDLRNRLVTMANVKTAEDFGLDLPSGTYERMAGSLDSDSEWADMESQDWFRSAQAVTEERNFLHWKLAFPEVFYEVDGSNRGNSGFDTVLGNPPWGAKFSEQEKRYTKSNYRDVIQRMTDSYMFFIRTMFDRLKHGGTLGYVLPSAVLTQSDCTSLRDFILSRSELDHIVNLGDDVFGSEVDNPSCILIGSHLESTQSDNSVSIHDVKKYDKDDKSEILDRKPDDQVVQEVYTNTHNSSFITQGVENEALVSRLRNKYDPLDTYVTRIRRGISADLNEASIVTEETVERKNLEDEVCESVLTGNHIRRYLINDPETYVVYLSREDEIERYPNIKSHLEEYRDQITCSEVRDSKHPWYALHRPRDPEIFDETKIVGLTTLDHIEVGLDREGNYTMDNLYVFSLNSSALEPQFFVTLLNSGVVDFIYRHLAQEDDRILPQVKAENLYPIPIPSIPQTETEETRGDDFEKIYQKFISGSLDTSGVLARLSDSSPSSVGISNNILHDSLCYLAKPMKIYHKQRNSLNLKFIDYFDSNDNGCSLDEIGLYQPPKGVGNSMLTDTNQDHSTLRIGTVSCDRKGSSTVVVNATARYKPTNEGVHETDQWGYTETDLLPALRITDLTELEADLIEAFVPVAADKASGFANFRETATKTNSLVDRLEALTLPRLADVEDGLERYCRTKEQAEELDEKIAKTDELIDQIVYQLYGLTDEEIEIVESSGEDD